SWFASLSISLRCARTSNKIRQYRLRVSTSHGLNCSLGEHRSVPISCMHTNCDAMPVRKYLVYIPIQLAHEQIPSMYGEFLAATGAVASHVALSSAIACGVRCAHQVHNKTKTHKAAKCAMLVGDVCSFDLCAV